MRSQLMAAAAGFWSPRPDAGVPAYAPAPGPRQLHVTRGQFEAATCNRCGDCCEDFSLPLLALITINLSWVGHDCETGWMPRRPTITHVKETPGGPILERALPWIPCSPSVREEHEDARRRAEWMLDIEPAGEALRVPAKQFAERPRARYHYRCRRFARDASGQGLCTRYEERSSTCALFPYGVPQTQYARCTWSVQPIVVRHAAAPVAVAVEEAQELR